MLNVHNFATVGHARTNIVYHNYISAKFHYIDLNILIESLPGWSCIMCQRFALCFIISRSIAAPVRVWLIIVFSCLSNVLLELSILLWW